MGRGTQKDASLLLYGSSGGVVSENANQRRKESKLVELFWHFSSTDDPEARLQRWHKFQAYALAETIPNGEEPLEGLDAYAMELGKIIRKHLDHDALASRQVVRGSAVRADLLLARLGHRLAFDTVLDLLDARLRADSQSYMPNYAHIHERLTCLLTSPSVQATERFATWAEVEDDAITHLQSNRSSMPLCNEGKRSPDENVATSAYKVGRSALAVGSITCPKCRSAYPPYREAAKKVECEVSDIIQFYCSEVNDRASEEFVLDEGDMPFPLGLKEYQSSYLDALAAGWARFVAQCASSQIEAASILELHAFFNLDAPSPPEQLPKITL